jgi:hypothetical protein
MREILLLLLFFSFIFVKLKFIKRVSSLENTGKWSKVCKKLSYILTWQFVTVPKQIED